MRRRDFIAGLGAATWPLVAHAQQRAEQLRRIGMLVGFDENDFAGQTNLSAFIHGLERFGWVNGRKQIHVRGSAGGIEHFEANTEWEQTNAAQHSRLAP